jgi:hypothetical protein
MRGIILTVLLFWLLLFWLAAQLYTFWRSKNKSTEAKLTVAYIVGYPLLLVYLALNTPLSAAILFPVAMGGLPWLFAGTHLRKIIAEGYRRNPGEFIGIPLRYWLGIGIGTFLLGVMLQYLGQF